MLKRKLVAEALGTALLLATVVGSGIMAEQLAGGNVAVALIGNTLATAAMLVVLITMLGPVSGAHFNSAVSAVFAWRRELSIHELFLYWGVQLIGAVLGVWAAHAMFDLDILQTSSKIRTGPGQWFAEGIATAGLVLTILGTRAHRPSWIPLNVGLYIAAAYWFTASTSFANPVVTIARSLSDSFAGIRPLDVPGFIAAQLVGAGVGHAISRFLFDPAAPE